MIGEVVAPARSTCAMLIPSSIFDCSIPLSVSGSSSFLSVILDRDKTQVSFESRSRSDQDERESFDWDKHADSED